METLRNAPKNVESEDRLKVVMLLTDGQPNELPERGHITELRDYKD
jgi:Mg-chelatase subunit ChlD